MRTRLAALLAFAPFAAALLLGAETDSDKAECLATCRESDHPNCAGICGDSNTASCTGLNPGMQ